MPRMAAAGARPSSRANECPERMPAETSREEKRNRNRNMNKTMTMMKTNKIFLRMLGCFAVLSALQGLQAQTPGLSYPVPLDEAHFPDKAFREFLWYNIDENEDGQLSVEECGAVEEKP